MAGMDQKALLLVHHFSVAFVGSFRLPLPLTLSSFSPVDMLQDDREGDTSLDSSKAGRSALEKNGRNLEHAAHHKPHGAGACKSKDLWWLEKKKADN